MSALIKELHQRHAATCVAPTAKQLQRIAQVQQYLATRTAADEFYSYRLTECMRPSAHGRRLVLIIEKEAKKPGTRLALLTNCLVWLYIGPRGALSVEGRNQETRGQAQLEATGIYAKYSHGWRCAEK